MNSRNCEIKKAALVLAHGKRHRNESKFIIPIFRAIVNGISAGLIGLSVAMLVLLGVAAFAAIFAPAVGLAMLGDWL